MTDTTTIVSLPPARRKPPGRKTHPQRGDKQYGKTAIANGHGLLPGIDGRSLVAKRFKEISNALLVDRGGEDLCSESIKQYIRRFAAAAVLAELLEAKLANGEEIDMVRHALLCSTMVRVGNKIGVDRIPKTISTLGEQIREDQEEQRRARAREHEQQIGVTVV
jgi:hypothetical protein